MSVTQHEPQAQRQLPNQAETSDSTLQPMIGDGVVTSEVASSQSSLSSSSSHGLSSAFSLKQNRNYGFGGESMASECLIDRAVEPDHHDSGSSSDLTLPPNEIKQEELSSKLIEHPNPEPEKKWNSPRFFKHPNPEPEKKWNSPPKFNKYYFARTRPIENPLPLVTKNEEEESSNSEEIEPIDYQLLSSLVEEKTIKSENPLSSAVIVTQPINNDAPLQKILTELNEANDCLIHAKSLLAQVGKPYEQLNDVIKILNQLVSSPELSQKNDLDDVEKCVINKYNNLLFSVNVLLPRLKTQYIGSDNQTFTVLERSFYHFQEAYNLFLSEKRKNESKRNQISYMSIVRWNPPSSFLPRIHGMLGLFGDIKDDPFYEYSDEEK